MDEKEKQVTPKEVIKIPHRRSESYSSHHASGAILSISRNEDLHYLVFYSDSVKVNSETGNLTGKEKDAAGEEYFGYEISIKEGDIERYREDRVTISLTRETLLSLQDLLNKRIPPEPKSKVDGDGGKNEGS